MQEKWSFPDASKLYSKKLVAERCLLAIARYGASQQLETSDVEALRSLRQMLTDVFEVDYQVNIASLSADTSTNINIVVKLLLTTKLVPSVPALKKYLQEMIQTISSVENAAVVDRKQKDRVVEFAEVLSTSFGGEIAARAKSKDTVVCAL